MFSQRKQFFGTNSFLGKIYKFAKTMVWWKLEKNMPRNSVYSLFGKITEVDEVGHSSSYT